MTINRLEIINHSKVGGVLIHEEHPREVEFGTSGNIVGKDFKIPIYNKIIEGQYQDDGNTLKIFISEK